MMIFLSGCDEEIETSVNGDGQIVYQNLDDAVSGFADEYGVTLVYDYPAAEFELEDSTYRLFLCKGDETRLAVYAAKFIRTKEGYVINGDDPEFTKRYHQDVDEPIDEELKIIEMEIDDTGMKFVCGKAFWKRYKPYYNGEYHGRLDRNSMFFYAMKNDENVEIQYR